MAYKTARPTGLSIKRHNNYFVISWKITDKDRCDMDLHANGRNADLIDGIFHILYAGLLGIHDSILKIHLIRLSRLFCTGKARHCKNQ